MVTDGIACGRRATDSRVQVGAKTCRPAAVAAQVGAGIDGRDRHGRVYKPDTTEVVSGVVKFVDTRTNARELGTRYPYECVQESRD